MTKLDSNVSGFPSTFSLDDFYAQFERSTATDELVAPPPPRGEGRDVPVSAGGVSPATPSAPPPLVGMEASIPVASLPGLPVSVQGGQEGSAVPAAASEAPTSVPGALAVSVAPAVAGPAPERSRAPGERLLVQWSAAATPEQRLALLATLGGVRRDVIHTTPMKARGDGVMEVIQLPAGADATQALAACNATAGVCFAEVDRLLQAQAVSNDTHYNSGGLWGMYGGDSPVANGPSGTTNIFGSNAEAAWKQGFTGSKSVYVGILDTGVDYQHEDLAANLWLNPYEFEDGIDNDGNGYVDDIRGWNFLDDTNNVFDPFIDDHGTHVAGTIGAVGGNNIGMAGVNWDVTMIASKFMGLSGGYISGAIQALDYITDLKWRHGLNIVATNNSWMSGGYSQAMYEAIVRSAQQDILFVASAGNQSSNNDLYPIYPSAFSTTAEAGYDSVITVGALTSTGQRAWFSNYGLNSVDLAAPGDDILSTVPLNDYSYYSGTSMAAPYVTGAVALYASRYPGSTAEQIRAALLASTTPTASMAGSTVSGGRLDVMTFLNTVVPPAFGITADQAFLAEGQTGVTSYGFKITRHGSTAGTASVSWQVAGTGLAPADAEDFIGQTLPGGTVTFAPGQSTKAITVQVKTDTVVESMEAFKVSLTNPSGGGTLAAGRASASGLILNDDGVVLGFQSGAITIPSFGPAFPAPSSITVSTAGQEIVSSVEVTLYNFYHSSLDDVDILLVGPTGATSFLMSDCGGNNSVNGITLTFSPQAAASLPDEAPITAGTWLPTNAFSEDLYGQPNNDDFGPAVLSGIPYTADLSVFNGTNPNGVWSLFVRDDSSVAAGKIIDGWSLAISTQPATSTVSLAVSPNRVLEDGAASLLYTFSRSGPTTNALTVNYSVGGTATPGIDYSGIASQGSTRTVTFNAGASTATVMVSPTADTEVEADETVSLTLAQGTGYTVGTVDPVIGTIQDDDTVQMEGAGASRLIRDAGNRLFVQSGSSAPVGLRFRGRAILRNSFPGWEPLAAETFSGVNQMLWKNLAGNYVSLWTMDSNWSWLSSTGEWGMNSAGALLQEVNFGLDLNGNGVIGLGRPGNGILQTI
ncbi:MAG: S8 family serine peptidase [Cyanobacteriota bacterium]